MSMSRHLINLLAFDSFFAREAMKTTFMKSQGAMNFLFVRIYKSANLEYLEKSEKDNFNRFYKVVKFHVSAMKLNSHFYIYKIQKEEFRNFIRKNFIKGSILEEFTKYYQWKRNYDSGLATASLMYYNFNEANSFWGKSLSEPLVHKYDILSKLWNISDISMTHTSYKSYNSSGYSHFDPMDLENKQEGSETTEDFTSRMSQSVSLPNLEKLLEKEDQSIQKKTMVSEKRSREKTILQMWKDSINFTHTLFVSIASNGSMC